MESSQENGIIESISTWWQSIVQSLLALFFSHSVTFATTGRTVYYSGDAGVGEGAYSVVLKASSAFEGSRQYALKKMLIQSEETRCLVNNEIQAFLKFKHSSIIELLDSTTVNEGGKQVAYLLFPLMPRGNLRSLISTSAERHQRRLVGVLQGFLSICDAVNVLHTYTPSFVHQDIKLEVWLCESMQSWLFLISVLFCMLECVSRWQRRTISD